MLKQCVAMVTDSSQVSDWRFQSLEQLQESSSDEDEFYDAQGKAESNVYFRSRFYSFTKICS